MKTNHLRLSLLLLLFSNICYTQNYKITSETYWLGGGIYNQVDLKESSTIKIKKDRLQFILNYNTRKDTIFEWKIIKYYQKSTSFNFGDEYLVEDENYEKWKVYLHNVGKTKYIVLKNININSETWYQLDNKLFSNNSILLSKWENEKMTLDIYYEEGVTNPYYSCITEWGTPIFHTFRFDEYDRYTFYDTYTFKLDFSGEIKKINNQRRMYLNGGRIFLTEVTKDSEKQKKIEALNQHRLDSINKLRMLNLFNIERKNKIYDYKEVSPDGYELIKKEIRTELYNFLKKNKGEKFSGEIQITFTIDTLNQTNQSIKYIKGKRNKEIDNLLSKITLSPILLNDLPINAKMEENFVYSSENMINMEILTSKNGLTCQNCKDSIFIKHKEYFQKIFINSDEEEQIYGLFKINFINTQINNQNNKSYELIDFKSIGKPYHALYSCFIPGLGNKFVNSGKGSMFGENINPIVTTLSVYSCLGISLFAHFDMINNYKLYHNSTNQVDIDKYYDLANSNAKTSRTFLFVGSALWLLDITWTARKGIKNKIYEKTIKEKINFTLHPSIGMNHQSLTFKINF